MLSNHPPAQVVIETHICLFGDSIGGCQYHQRVRLIALSVCGVAVCVWVRAEPAMCVEPQPRRRHLVHYRVYLEEHGLTLLLHEHPQHLAPIALPAQGGINGKMLDIDIGVKLPIRDKPYPFPRVRIARKVVLRLPESQRLLPFRALLEDGKNCFRTTP